MVVGQNMSRELAAFHLVPENEERVKGALFTTIMSTESLK